MSIKDIAKNTWKALLEAPKKIVGAVEHGAKHFVREDTRLQNIDKYKDIVKQYEQQLDKSKEIVNRQIRKYNDTIPLINQKRRADFRDILEELYRFLLQLGKLAQNKWDFSFEMTRAEELGFLEERSLTDYKAWIMPYEKTESQVFDEVAKGLIIGYRIENGKWNEEIEKKCKEIRFATEGVQKKYASIAQQWQDRTFIAATYLECIELIHETITERIIPELELISAFLLAESVKNNIIANIPIENAKPLDISAIKGTIYGRHYTFVKNAFQFYILSRQIYQSPILTRLTQAEQSTSIYSNDKLLITQQKELLQQQSDVLCADIMR